jgi:hypothetical protein
LLLSFSEERRFMTKRIPIAVDQPAVAKLKQEIRPGTPPAAQASSRDVEEIRVTIARRLFLQKFHENFVVDLDQHPIVSRARRNDIGDAHAIVEWPSKRLPRLSHLVQSPHGWMWQRPHGSRARESMKHYDEGQKRGADRCGRR